MRWRRVPLDELAQACARCGHQNGGHVDSLERTRSGWPIYDPIWADALGACSVPGCPCRGRTNDPATRIEQSAVPVADRVPVLTRLSGPCTAGTGPCGALPTRPYPVGPRCAEHAPTAIRQTASQRPAERLREAA
ncbi:hypothetical protein [Acrocarpospora catenulata]|uniref:hypothetical protein n=1 Tax=Acrocarpospora catenulata TaxID=2836182 RepID=UPI001BD9FA44|nr:hypothetical protein [Acrocarpospora catenulata]